MTDFPQTQRTKRPKRDRHIESDERIRMVLDMLENDPDLAELKDAPFTRVLAHSKVRKRIGGTRFDGRTGNIGTGD